MERWALRGAAELVVVEVEPDDVTGVVGDDQGIGVARQADREHGLDADGSGGRREGDVEGDGAVGE